MIPISSPVDEGSAEKKPNSKSEAAAITSHRGGNHKPSRKGRWSQLNPAACSVPPRKNASQFSTSLCFLPPPPSQPRRADRRPMTLPRRRHSDTTTATTRHRRTSFACSDSRISSVGQTTAKIGDHLQFNGSPGDLMELSPLFSDNSCVAEAASIAQWK
nr:hypothetical protein MANES_05G029800 [Ipomoea trifida]